MASMFERHRGAPGERLVRLIQSEQQRGRESFTGRQMHKTPAPFSFSPTPFVFDSTLGGHTHQSPDPSSPTRHRIVHLVRGSVQPDLAHQPSVCPSQPGPTRYPITRHPPSLYTEPPQPHHSTPSPHHPAYVQQQHGSRPDGRTTTTIETRTASGTGTRSRPTGSGGHTALG